MSGHTVVNKFLFSVEFNTYCHIYKVLRLKQLNLLQSFITYSTNIPSKFIHLSTSRSSICYLLLKFSFLKKFSEHLLPLPNLQLMSPFSEAHSLQLIKFPHST